MDVDVGRRKTPDGPVVAEWYPRVFVTNLTLAMAIDPGEVEVGGEDATEPLPDANFEKLMRGLGDCLLYTSPSPRD